MMVTRRCQCGDERDQVIIPARSIDGDPGVRPSLPIFVGSKAPWHDITDTLPQHEAFPAR